MHKQAYTLLELLICMMIIVILSSMSYYFYQHHLVNTRRADAQLALIKLSSALENYYLEHNSYKEVTFNKLHFSDKSPQGFYQLSIELLQDAQSYAIKATPLGVQAKEDQACGTLILYTDGRRTYAGEDPGAVCW